MAPKLTEIRVRTRLPREQLAGMKGKVLSDLESSVRLTGPCKVVMPDGRPLCFYLPGALLDTPQEVLDVLHSIKDTTRQRQVAGGAGSWISGRVRHGKEVHSSTVGYMEPRGGKQGHGLGGGDKLMQCRMTEWTGAHADKFESLFPLFQTVSALFRQYVPGRWGNQKRRYDATDEDFRIPDTVFTTLTVNNTWATGVHLDKGDLDEGFSCLGVFRRGEFEGGVLTFPEWRVSVDMQHGDLILMDAHQYHGNTDLRLIDPDAERVSVVLYYRTEMVKCRSEDG